MERFIYLTWKDYGKMATELAGRVLRSRHKFDVVVGIARGGVPLSMVIADELGVRIEIINVKSYNGTRGDRTRPHILSTLTSSLGGRRVLLVDDLIEEGDTIMAMSKYLLRQKPKSLETAVMFTKPWNKVKPDFSLMEVDKWVVFPWDRCETKRIIGRMGARRKKYI